MQLFIIAVVAASGFALLAAWLAPRGGNAPRRRRRSLSAEFLEGCRDLSKAACAAFQPTRRDPSVRTGAGGAITDASRLEPATDGLRDAALLSRRMRALHVDPERLARNEPLLFRHLAIRCRQCASRGQCARDLDRAWDDSIAEDWKDYCVNVALLRMLSAIEGIGATHTAAAISARGNDMLATGESRP